MQRSWNIEASNNRSSEQRRRNSGDSWDSRVIATGNVAQYADKPLIKVIEADSSIILPGAASSFFPT